MESNNNDPKGLDRRSFLQTTGLTLAGAGMGLVVSPRAEAMGTKPKPVNYTKFLNPNADVGTLTESAIIAASKAGSLKNYRFSLLTEALKAIPDPRRVQQIHDIILKHVDAEERNDLAATMDTLDPDPRFENIAEGKVFKNHEEVAADYRERYQGLKRTLHITNLTIDAKGGMAEMLWEGEQIGNYKGLAPSSDARKFYLPMVVYYEVSDVGLIKREAVYFDQYLGYLAFDVIDDILGDKMKLIQLKGSLIWRGLKAKMNKDE